MDDGNLYVAVVDGQSILQLAKVKKHPKDDASSAVLLAQGMKTRGLALMDKHIVFADAGQGAVMRVPKVRGSLEVLAIGQGTPTNVAVAPGALYWTNEASGQVMALTLNPPGLKELAFGQGGPWGIAVNGQLVFCTNRSSGDLMAVAR